MRSRAERITWGVVAALLVAGSGAAWFTRDSWLPEAGPWLQQLWRKSTRPGPETLPADRREAAERRAQPAPPPPHKCVAADGHTSYTDQPCPAGMREYGVDGAVTVLPATGQPPAPRR